MKNKMAIVAVLLGCQVMTSSAAFAFGDDDRRIDAILQAPLQTVAQGDMGFGDSPNVNQDSGDSMQVSSAGPGAKVEHRRSSRGGFKRKHGAKGHSKRHLSSRVRSKAASGSPDNACCASPSSGM